MFSASRQCRNLFTLHSLRLQRPHNLSSTPKCPQLTLRRNASTPKRLYTSLPQNQGGKDRAAVGVFTPKAAALFVVAGVGLFFYFRYEKQKLLEQRQKERESRTIGRAHVGGPFTLTTHLNKPFSELDLLGKWNLVYFGFTNCPDICPAELDKVGVVVDALGQFFLSSFWPGAMYNVCWVNRKRTRGDLPTTLHIRRPSTRHPRTSNPLPKRFPSTPNRTHRGLHHH